jgi:hypothetical protein
MIEIGLHCKMIAKLLLGLVFISTLSLAESNLVSKTNQALSSPLSNKEINTLPLFKSRWQLRSINGQPLLPGAIITMEFGKHDMNYYLHSLFENNNSCYGSFSLYPNNQFKILNYCHEYDRPPPDHDYIVTFYTVTHYKIEGDVLSFFNKQNEIILQYYRLSSSKTRPDNIFGKTWQLAAVTGMAGADLAEFTLHFADQKPISDFNRAESGLDNLQYSDNPTFNGTTSCQNYKGNYFVVENMLAVASLSRTSRFTDNLTEQDLFALDKDIETKSKNDRQVSHYFFRLLSNLKLQNTLDLFCSKKDIDAKNTYIELLKNVWRYEASETQLELYSDHSKKLVFALVNQK